MTSKYLARATPKAYESVKELVELWRGKVERTSNVFEAEGDLQAATMVCLLVTWGTYKLIDRMLFVCYAYVWDGVDNRN